MVVVLGVEQAVLDFALTRGGAYYCSGKGDWWGVGAVLVCRV